MIRIPVVGAILGALLASAGTGCSSASSDGGPDTRRQLLTDLVDIVYLPTYRDFAGQTPRLTEAVSALCADPTPATHTAAQDIWREIRRPWKQAEAHGFGPVVELRIDGSIDFWPVRSGDIEEEIGVDTPVTDEYIAGLGATRKGLPVLEYLLFGELARLHDDGVGNRTCAYAEALARAVESDAGRLVTAWEPAGDDFRGELIQAGDGSDTYSKLADAVNDSANAIFIATERAESLKLAKPLGRRDGGIVQPDAVESRYSDNSVADLVDTIVGIRNSYTSTYAGASGTSSYSAVVASIDAALDEQVRTQLDRCDAAIADIAGPLADAVVNAPGTVEPAFECTKELLRLFKVDVAGALGVTPTFGDVDGD